MAIRHTKKTRTLAAFMLMLRIEDALWKRIPYIQMRRESPEYEAWSIVQHSLCELAKDLGASSYTEARWNVFAE